LGGSSSKVFENENMKISILTTITEPIKRQDKYKEAFNCYKDMADELVVVDGCGYPDNRIDILSDKMKVVFLKWADEWSWEELPKHLNAGLEQCSGDWVIKLDIDQFFHEKDKDNIRKQLKYAEEKAYITASFEKFTVFSPTRAFQKGKVPIAINRRYQNMGFGLDEKKETDLCYPILIKSYKKINGYKLPVGDLISENCNYNIKKIRLYNYDYFFKTIDFSLLEFERFARAYERFFMKKPFGKNTFLDLRESYKNKYSYKLKLDDHPKYIRQAVKEVIDNKLKVIGNL